MGAVAGGRAGQEQVAGPQLGDASTRSATSRATSKIMSAVDSSCMTLAVQPQRDLQVHRIARRTRAGTSNGPVGRKVGAFLRGSQSVPIAAMSGRKTRSRVVTSLQIV